MRYGYFRTVLERHDGCVCVCVRVCMRDVLRCVSRSSRLLVVDVDGWAHRKRAGGVCVEKCKGGHGDNGYIKASESLCEE